jgi:hypothetical protein
MTDHGIVSRRVVSPALVGRGGELSSAVSTPPSIVVLEGGAGIGKTRLLTELRHRLDGSGQWFLTGWCRRIREPFPLAPVIEAVRGLGDELPGGVLSPVAGALRPLLPELTDVLPPQPLEVAGSLGPAVLALEDLHWADEQTIDSLNYLLADLPSKLSLVMTFRGEEVEPALTAKLPPPVSLANLRLDPLDGEETGGLAEAILGGRVSREFSRYLHEHTSGLPFAVEEVLALLRTRGALVSRGRRWSCEPLAGLDVPTSIRDSVLERVSRLPPDARLVVEAAAVLQSAVPSPVLIRICAAEQATRLGHRDEAVRLVADLLRHPPLDTAHRGRIAVDLARVAIETLHAEDVSGLLLEVPTEQLTRGVRSELRFLLALLLNQAGGDPELERQLLRDAVDELDGRPDLKAWAMIGLGVPAVDPAVSTAEHLQWPGRMHKQTGGTLRRRREVSGYESVASDACYAGHHQIAGQLLAASAAGAALCHSHRAGGLDVLPLPVGALLRLAVAGGDPQPALEIGRRVVAGVRTKGIWAPAARLLPPLAEAMVAGGRLDEAIALVDRMSGHMAHLDAPLASAAVAHARGFLTAERGQGRRAVGHFQTAATRYGSLTCPYEAAQAREAAACAPFAIDHPAAEHLLRKALQGYRRIGTGRDASRAAGAARRHGMALPAVYRGGRRGYGNRLSPREREVAQLAAAGLTNDEIARQLFLSPKTVDKHVCAALRNWACTHGGRSRHTSPARPRRRRSQMPAETAARTRARAILGWLPHSYPSPGAPDWAPAAGVRPYGGGGESAGEKPDVVPPGSGTNVGGTS